jgi:hypothetical protein
MTYDPNHGMMRPRSSPAPQWVQATPAADPLDDLAAAARGGGGGGAPQLHFHSYSPPSRGAGSAAKAGFFGAFGVIGAFVALALLGAIGTIMVCGGLTCAGAASKAARPAPVPSEAAAEDAPTHREYDLTDPSVRPPGDFVWHPSYIRSDGTRVKGQWRLRGLRAP